MLIPIPNDSNDNQSQMRSELNSTTTGDQRDYQRIREYLNVPPWKCPVCKGTMFGRMEYCSYCKRPRVSTGEQR